MLKRDEMRLDRGNGEGASSPASKAGEVNEPAALDSI